MAVVTREKPGRLDISKLCSAMRKDRLVLRKVRENRRNMVQQLVGRHWSEFGSAEPVLVNLIAKYQSVVGRMLISKNPRVKLTVEDRSAKPIASQLEAYANKRFEQMRLESTLSRAVVDSLYSIGIVKVALANPADSALASWGVPAGFEFAEAIDLDDFVIDTHAGDIDRYGYIGHRVRVPLDAARRMFGKRGRELEPTEHSQYNAEGDERVDVLFRGYYSSREEYEDMVDLWEVYMPRHNKVLTLASSQIVGSVASSDGGGDVVPLEERKWVGPPTGPYHLLSMMTVPGNMWPKAPIQDVFDLHLVYNEAMKKLVYQAESQKDITAVVGGKTEDGERTVNARDREMIQCQVVPQLVQYPGPNQGVFNLAQYIDGQFNRESGNLDLMAGSGPQSRTARQDMLLNANANRVIGDMQDRVVVFTEKVAKSLLWFMHYHPTNTLRSEFEAAPGISIVRTSTPAERRQVPIDLMDIRVDPYSMRHKTPEERLEMISGFVRNTIMPVYGLLQQQGIAFDWNEFLKMFAELGDEPRLKDLLTLQDVPEGGPMGMGGGGQQGATKPPDSTREYIRRSEGAGKTGPTPYNQSQDQSNGQMTGA